MKTDHGGVTIGFSAPGERKNEVPYPRFCFFWGGAGDARDPEVKCWALE